MNTQEIYEEREKFRLYIVNHSYTCKDYTDIVGIAISYLRKTDKLVDDGMETQQAETFLDIYYY